MVEKFIHVREFDIPDDSSPDGVAPAMWGSYMGDGKMYRFFCKDCTMFINVRFPRWDRVLTRERKVDGVMNGHFKCPSCIKSNFIEIEVGKNE